MPWLNKLIRRFDRWLHDRRVATIKQSLKQCGDSVSIDLPTVIRGAEHIELGARVSINAFVHIWGQGGLVVGDDTLIASHVAITTLSHDPAAEKFNATTLTRPIRIGRNVWIGTHATILPGVSIGDGAIVGAGAVVRTNVAAGETVVGVPARPLGQRRAP